MGRFSRRGQIPGLFRLVSASLAVLPKRGVPPMDFSSAGNARDWTYWCGDVLAEGHRFDEWLPSSHLVPRFAQVGEPITMYS